MKAFEQCLNLTTELLKTEYSRLKSECNTYGELLKKINGLSKPARWEGPEGTELYGSYVNILSQWLKDEMGGMEIPRRPNET